MALDRWQQQLCDLLAAVHRKQQQYDRTASACQVLLKPWPKKSLKNGCTDKKDALDCNDNAKTADQQIHPQEEAELKVVNDVLKRAQKARVKNVSKEVKEPVTHIEDPVSARSERELLEICDSNSQSVQLLEPQLSESKPESVCKEYQRPDKSKPSPVIKMTGNSRKNIGTTQSDRLARTSVSALQQKQAGKQSDGQRSHSVNKYPSSISSRSAKPGHTGDTQRPQSQGSSQPPSRPGSSRGKFKPAHVTAPFKTDPTLPASKRSVKNNIRPIKQQHSAGKRQNYAGDRNYGNRVLPPIDSEKDQLPSSETDRPACLACDVQEGVVLPDSCDMHSDPAYSEPQPRLENQINSNLEEPLNRLHSLTLNDNTAGDVCIHNTVVRVETVSEASNSQAEEKQETKLFSLLSDGSGINIPPKVRRAFAKNQQLRKKVSHKDTVRKAKSGEGNTGHKFVEKLQQLFDAEEELVYRQQALECLHTHQQLLLLLTQLDMDRLTEASSAGDILRSKTLAEYVLSSFSELSDEVNFYSKVQFPETPTVKQPHHKEVGHPLLWLPASLQGGNWSSAHKLQYTSRTDLNQYMDALLRLQTLRCQHHVLDILVSDVLPWLQQQDCKQKDFGTIFRGLFAVLTSDGCQLPVLIRDSSK